MYCDILLVKFLELPSWVEDKEDWEPYIMQKLVKLPFAPFSGLIVTGKHYREQIMEVEYMVEDAQLEGRCQPDCSAGEMSSLETDEQVQTYLDKLVKRYEGMGWKHYYE